VKDAAVQKAAREQRARAEAAARRAGGALSPQRTRSPPRSRELPPRADSRWDVAPWMEDTRRVHDVWRHGAAWQPPGNGARATLTRGESVVSTPLVSVSRCKIWWESPK
jgi:hypothetical protein